MSGPIDQWVGEIDYPMYIVTVAAGGERSGCLVGFATQCSIDPVRFLVCLSDKNHTYRVAQDADVLAVHLVPATADDLVALFGSETGDEIDKFERCAWREGPAGVPILDDCPNWFAGRILDRLPAGDHAAFLLEPIEAGANEDPSQFDFHRAKHFEPGHEA
ncbi:MAG TPA: flavin reductase family protein [Aeromicrobium sp.]|nr:flavin reductase family protein [Aeromicrobium sp.]